MKQASLVVQVLVGSLSLGEAINLSSENEFNKINSLNSLAEQRSFSSAPGYPVRSTIGPRNPANQAWYIENDFPTPEGAWSKANLENSHEGNYIND